MKVRPLLVAVAALCSVSYAAHAEVCANITNELVKIDAGNDEWTEATKLKEGDVIMVLASGSVTFPHMLGKLSTDAKGYSVDGSGGLEMKFGAGNVIHTGARWVGAAAKSGTIKFRVIGANKGGGHNNMTGGYSVRVVVLPAGTLPPTVKIESE
jgi:hypothetical protein